MLFTRIFLLLMDINLFLFLLILDNYPMYNSENYFSIVLGMYEIIYSKFLIFQFKIFSNSRMKLNHRIMLQNAANQCIYSLTT